MIDKSNLDKLIDASRRKDEKAFRLLVEEFQGLVYSISFRLLCNESEAEDITQETFIRVWMNLDKYDSGKKFTTWLYTIATNLCFDRLKQESRFLNNVSEAELMSVITPEDTEEQLNNKELAALILSITQELTPKQKIVFTLRYIEELNVEEIIQITDMSAGKIKSNLFLAKQFIRNKLKNMNHDE